VTYNFHILVRTELEIALFEGRLAIRDLPGAWNDAYRRLLGVEPSNDAEGVLQDVHWSTGAFGYFPSYTLGNLYMAALGRRMQRDLPDLWSDVGDGSFAPILGWMREKVHAPGALLDAPDRMREIVGDVDLVDELLGHLWGRHGALYGVARS
jgi:carboxypeptidase Taq